MSLYYLIPFSLIPSFSLSTQIFPIFQLNNKKYISLSLIYLKYCVHHLALLLTQGISRIYREYFSYQVVNRHCPVQMPRGHWRTSWGCWRTSWGRSKNTNLTERSLSFIELWWCGGIHSTGTQVALDLATKVIKPPF